MRLFLAMLSHETNTFSNVPTDRAQFEARDLRYGGEIVEAYPRHRHVPGRHDRGGRAPAARRCCPSVAAAASPAGLVTRDIYEHVKERMLADLKAAGRLDGVLLDLHGAMVPEGLDDGEGDLIAAVRRGGGARRADRGDARLPRQPRPGHGRGRRPAPRLQDLPARGHGRARRGGGRAARPRSSAGRLKPTAAWRKPPLLPPLGNQGTARGPMRRLYDLADEMEKDPKVISISHLRGLPATRTSPTRASASTSSPTTTRPWPSGSPTGSRAWRGSTGTSSSTPRCPCSEAVAKALAADGRPIVLADMADNTGGGAAGDGTEILRELLRVGARSARRWPASGTRRRCGRA